MKSILIILLLVWVSLTYSQTGDINVTVNRMSDSGSDWELNFSVNLNFNPGSGLSFQLPAGISVIPVSIQLNGREMWLQKKMALPDRDSVLTWEFTAQSLSIFFRNGFLKNGDVLTVKCQARIQQTDSSPNTVILKEAFITVNGINLSDRDFGSGAIPVIANQEEN
ncbi:MAG: hypothetical protein P8Y60_14415 [Calditrichota bacterium]